jgi:hypothetical protein
MTSPLRTWRYTSEVSQDDRGIPVLPKHHRVRVRYRRQSRVQCRAPGFGYMQEMNARHFLSSDGGMAIITHPRLLRLSRRKLAGGPPQRDHGTRRDERAVCVIGAPDVAFVAVELPQACP